VRRWHGHRCRRRLPLPPFLQSYDQSLKALTYTPTHPCVCYRYPLVSISVALDPGRGDDGFPTQRCDRADWHPARWAIGKAKSPRLDVSLPPPLSSPPGCSARLSIHPRALRPVLDGHILVEDRPLCGAGDDGCSRDPLTELTGTLPGVPLAQSEPNHSTPLLPRPSGRASSRL
jgi:hypothetical protein